jgi:hypothetical protein
MKTIGTRAFSNTVDLICRRTTESKEKMKNHILGIDGKLDETDLKIEAINKKMATEKTLGDIQTEFHVSLSDIRTEFRTLLLVARCFSDHLIGAAFVLGLIVFIGMVVVLWKLVSY